MKVEDNERKNVEFPSTPITGTIKHNHIKTAFSFTKIDPTKEGWGDITLTAVIKDGKAKGNASITPGSINVSTAGTVSFVDNLNSFYNVGPGVIGNYGLGLELNGEAYPQDGYEEAVDGGLAFMGERPDEEERMDGDQADDEYGEYNEREWNNFD